MSADVDPAAVELAVAVLAESARHKLRSPGKRAAGHVWVALMTTSSTEAARRAITTFGTKDVQRDALALLDRLTADVDATGPRGAARGRGPMREG